MVTSTPGIVKLPVTHASLILVVGFHDLAQLFVGTISDVAHFERTSGIYTICITLVKSPQIH